MEDRYNDVYNFLAELSYPEGYDKAQRQNLRRYASKFSLQGGQLLFGTRRAVKTQQEKRQLFDEFHSAPLGGHTGMHKTRSALCSRFYWPGMTVDIDKWIQECEQCQKVGKPLTAVQPLQCIKVSDVWELVGIDLTGPLPRTKTGYQYILTATDYFSKWVEAFPLRTKSATEVAENLCKIIYRHGCPTRILSDQGREFVNELNTGLCHTLRIQRSVTAAYHPQTNGLDEKTNDNIKRALRKLVNDQQDDWDIFLDATLFSLRSKVHTTTKHTPFQLMYGREARFPAEVPAELPISTVILPQESAYTGFFEAKKQAREDTKEAVNENVQKGQEKQVAAHARKLTKRFQSVSYSAGDEVLLYNTRKRGRKGGRLQSDFIGPYTIQGIIGKKVTLKNSDGKILSTSHSIDHLKPYRRPESTDSNSVPKVQVETQEMPSRPSIICFTPKIDPPSTTNQSTPVSIPPQVPSQTQTIEDEVYRLWTAKDDGRVEAVIGPYKLYDTSFRTLEGSQWVSDEVIDAYLHSLIEKHKASKNNMFQKPVYHMDAVVAHALFSGMFRSLRKMKFPVEDIWLCPLNFSVHWILVIVNIPKKTLILIDPFGKEDYYTRKVLRNWRNYLKRMVRGAEAWQVETVQHNKQQDASSCGVLVMKFAENFITEESTEVLTTAEAVHDYRKQIACSLLQNPGDAEEYCIVCALLECDPEHSLIEMVQCGTCHRWAHLECAKYTDEQNYTCPKCL